MPAVGVGDEKGEGRGGEGVVPHPVQLRVYV